MSPPLTQNASTGFLSFSPQQPGQRSPLVGQERHLIRTERRYRQRAGQKLLGLIHPLTGVSSP